MGKTGHPRKNRPRSRSYTNARIRSHINVHNEFLLKRVLILVLCEIVVGYASIHPLSPFYLLAPLASPSIEQGQRSGLANLLGIIERNHAEQTQELCSRLGLASQPQSYYTSCELQSAAWRTITGLRCPRWQNGAPAKSTSSWPS